MNTIITSPAALLLGGLLSLIPWGGVRAQVRISSLPPAAALTGSELLLGVQSGADVAVTPTQIRTFTGGGGGGGTPGGSAGQLQYDNAGAFGGFTMAGDCTISVPTITCGRTGGVAFAASATVNALNASNITSGVLPAAQLPVNGVGLADLASLGANSLLGNATAASANVAAQPMPSCAGTTNALTWTSGSGFGCNTISNGGAVTTTGSPASGELASFSGAGSITNGNLSGDCTTANTLAVTCARTGGTAFGTAATQNTGTSGATIPLLNGGNTYSGTSQFTGQVKLLSSLTGSGGHVLVSATAPTAASGFATSPTVTSNDTAAFAVSEGASGTPSTTGVLTLPAATTGWICFANDETSATIAARQSAGATTSATITFSAAPANNDVIVFLCGAY